MTIYTKKGDKGKTGLIKGKRVWKNDLLICALGALDELNAMIDVLRAQKTERETNDILLRAQNNISRICAELAGPFGKLPSASLGTGRAGAKKMLKTLLSKKRIFFLEKRIDELEAKLPKLKKFITPGSGTQFQAYANLARTVCRRAERAIVELHRKKPVNPNVLAYLNRLSDFLFMISRNK